jgi:hypothetical protein
MPKPQITTLSSLKIFPSPTNVNNGFYPPQLTQTQINAIPTATLQAGAIVYNATTGFVQIYTSGSTWQTLVSSADNSNGYVTIAFAFGPPTTTAPFNTFAHGVGTAYFDTENSKLWLCYSAGTPGLWVVVDLT